MMTTPETEAVDYFRTLTLAELRRRQDLCRQQQRTAYDQQNDRAAVALQRMENDLTAAVYLKTFS